MRDAVGADVDVLIETHDRLTVPEAIRVARDLDEIGVTWMEAPVWAHDVSALSKVAESTTMRIVAGERFTNLRAFADLLACGRIDVVQPEYIELGGVGRLVQSAAIAEAYQALIAPHNAQQSAQHRRERSRRHGHAQRLPAGDLQRLSRRMGR